MDTVKAFFKFVIPRALWQLFVWLWGKWIWVGLSTFALSLAAGLGQLPPIIAIAIALFISACAVALIGLVVWVWEKLSNTRIFSKRELAITFRYGGSFEETDGFSTEVYRLFRIAVTNENTSKTIQNVSAQLTQVEGYDNPFLPIPLQEMHDRPTQGQAYKVNFDLDPTQTRYVNIAAKQEGLAGNGEITLCYSAHNRPNQIPDGEYKLHVLVTGRDVLAEKTILEISVCDGRLAMAQII